MTMMVAPPDDVARPWLGIGYDHSGQLTGVVAFNGRGGVIEVPLDLAALRALGQRILDEVSRSVDRSANSQESVTSPGAWISQKDGGDGAAPGA
jgi:hypothetical protein